MEQIELKYIDHDQFQIVYEFAGMYCIGNEYDKDTYRFSFPQLKSQKVMSFTGSTMDLLGKYEIPRFGEAMSKYARVTAREELEQELNKIIMDELSQRVLLSLIFEDMVIIGENK